MNSRNKTDNVKCSDIMGGIFRAHYRELRENFNAAVLNRNAVTAAAWSCAMSEVEDVYAELYGITADKARTELTDNA